MQEKNELEEEFNNLFAEFKNRLKEMERWISFYTNLNIIIESSNKMREIEQKIENKKIDYTSPMENKDEYYKTYSLIKKIDNLRAEIDTAECRIGALKYLIENTVSDDYDDFEWISIFEDYGLFLSNANVFKLEFKSKILRFMDWLKSSSEKNVFKKILDDIDSKNWNELGAISDKVKQNMKNII